MSAKSRGFGAADLGGKRPYGRCSAEKRSAEPPKVADNPGEFPEIHSGMEGCSKSF
jgi:hypothetical protein